MYPFIFLYHFIMYHLYGFRKRCAIRQMRNLRNKHPELPSLEQYTDKQIVEGCKNYIDNGK